MAEVPKKLPAGAVGYLGKVVFFATEGAIKTIENFQWTAKAKYATHDRHTKSQLIEFTGLEAQDITFEILLSAFLGADPMTEYAALRKYMDTGWAIPFKMGSHAYGHYRWVITAIQMKGNVTDKKGNWIEATVSVTLKEYNWR